MIGSFKQDTLVQQQNNRHWWRCDYHHAAWLNIHLTFGEKLDRALMLRLMRVGMELVVQMRRDRQDLKPNPQEDRHATDQRIARQSMAPTKWPKPFQTVVSQPTRIESGKNGKCK